MKRRPLLVAGVAGAALVAGGGTALWRRRRAGVPQVADADAGNLWSLTFESPTGAPIPMAGYRGKRLLLNFWATWCAPCVTEMPLLDAFARRHAAEGWNVLAIAIDKAASVRSFLTERKLVLPVAVASTTGLDLSRSLGNKVGALPFTTVFASDGRQETLRLGAVEQEVLDRWAATVE